MENEKNYISKKIESVDKQIEKSHVAIADPALLGTKRIHKDILAGLVEEKRLLENILNPWIKVTDRLPDLGERVIVFCESQGSQLCYLGHENVWHVTYNGSVAYLNITYWMPLPESPNS